MGDIQAEHDLYFKTGALLVDFLHSWSSPLTTLPACMEALWIDLYELGYIEEKDVHLVQLWLHALLEVGYDFPRPILRRYDNVVLMGNFNFLSEHTNVLMWQTS